ncbi:MAG TPA: cytosine permease, partial [Novosphingobium sp.]|nr:cytosine permease [Novosphingobium sp.]
MTIAVDQDHESAATLVEANSITCVPDEQRHGSVRDLFTLWFTTNIAPLPMVTGAMAVQSYGLSLGWAALAIVLGGWVGACVLGACSAQGPQLGLAQMIQSRGQFGRYGALLVVGIATTLYIGFFTSNTVLGGRSLATLVPGVPLPAGAMLCALAAATIGLLGYNVIHWLNRVGMVVMGAGLVAAFVAVLRQMPPGELFANRVTPLGFLSTFSLAAVWHISYACYTSDYSRYLPRSVGLRRPFLMSTAGAALGASAAFIFGAAAVAGAPAGAEPMKVIATHTGWLGPVLMVLFLMNIVSHNALNMYGAVLSIITAVQTFAARWMPGRQARMVLSVVVLAGCLSMATLSADVFVPRFIALVILLLLVLAPWTTINITDFYLIRRGVYDTEAMFAPDGGRYG